jgi:predicted deacylase
MTGTDDVEPFEYDGGVVDPGESAKFQYPVSERTWLRADTGGLVDMHHDEGDLVHENETVCTISSPFDDGTETVTAPFT